MGFTKIDFNDAKLELVIACAYYTDANLTKYLLGDNSCRKRYIFFRAVAT